MKDTAKKKILFVYRYNQLEEVLKHLDSTEYPKDFLYGMDFLRDRLPVSWINIRQAERRTLWRKLGFLVEKPFSLMTKLGMPLEVFVEFKKELGSADTILCVNDPISFGILFWKALGLIRGRVVVLMMSLSERLKYFPKNFLMIFFLRFLLRRAERVLTLSDIAQEPLFKNFKVPRDKMTTFHFGVDVDFWKPAPEVRRRDFILSVGNDMNRDYQTLVQAIPEHLPLVIVTKKTVDLQGEQNIKIVSGISDSELRHLYRACRLVVVPSRKITYESSGLSSTLQAMACAAPVLVSDAPPMREYFREKKHIFFYDAENAEDLKKKILVLTRYRKKLHLVGREAQQRVLKKFTTPEMSKTWLKILKISKTQNT